MKSLLFVIGVAILAVASPLLAIGLVGWDSFVDRFADFASWPGDKADGGLVQVLILIAITVTLLGLIIVYWQVRGAEASRRVQVMLQLSQQWDSAFLRVSRYKIQKVANDLSLLLARPNVSLDRDYYYWIGVSNFFEDLGIAVKRGWISLADAEDKFGPSIDRYYPLYWPFVDTRSDKRVLEWFRWLYERKRSSEWASVKQKYGDDWRQFWELSWWWKAPILGLTLTASIALIVGISVAISVVDDGPTLTPTPVPPTSTPSLTVTPTEVSPTPPPTPTPSPTPEPTSTGTTVTPTSIPSPTVISTEVSPTPPPTPTPSPTPKPTPTPEPTPTQTPTK